MTKESLKWLIKNVELTRQRVEESLRHFAVCRSRCTTLQSTKAYTYMYSASRARARSTCTCTVHHIKPARYDRGAHSDWCWRRGRSHQCRCYISTRRSVNRFRQICPWRNSSMICRCKERAVRASPSEVYLNAENK